MAANKRRGNRARRAILQDQNLADGARFCVSAARFHLGGTLHFRELMRTSEQPRVLETNYNKLVYHLRAFFWELMAAFDTLLQHINRTLRLDVEEHEVKWTTVSEALSRRREYNKLRERLASEYGSEWFSYINYFRQVASHRAPFSAEVAKLKTDPGDPPPLDAAPSTGDAPQAHSTTSEPEDVIGVMVRTASGRSILVGEALEQFPREMAELIQWTIDYVDHANQHLPQ